MSHLWPILTGVTLIDVWTLPHLGFWIFTGSTIWAFRLHKWLSFGICLGLAFSWEVFEKFAEHLWPDRWQDPESFINSWISDPLTCVIGFLGVWYLLDKRRRK